jgi:hypothetical protein
MHCRQGHHPSSPAPHAGCPTLPRADHPRYRPLAVLQPRRRDRIAHDAARVRRCRTAVAEILAGGDRVERNPIAIRDPHDLLNLLGGGRRHGARGDTLFGLVQKRRVGIALKIEILIAREHPLFTDNALELRQGTRIVGWAAARQTSEDRAHETTAPSRRPRSQQSSCPSAQRQRRTLARPRSACRRSLCRGACARYSTALPLVTREPMTQGLQLSL